MTAGTSVTVDVNATEQNIEDAVGRGVAAGLLRAGLAIEREAKIRAPVDTGSLRSSISTQVRGGGIDTVVTIGPNVKSVTGAPYDVYQEFGTGIRATVWGGGAAPGRRRIYPVRAKALAWRGRRETWGRVTTYSWTVTKRGATKMRESTQTTRYHGDTAFARSVAGAPAVRYMQRAIEATDIMAEFLKGWNSVMQ